MKLQQMQFSFNNVCVYARARACAWVCVVFVYLSNEILVVFPFAFLVFVCLCSVNWFYFISENWYQFNNKQKNLRVENRSCIVHLKGLFWFVQLEQHVTFSFKHTIQVKWVQIFLLNLLWFQTIHEIDFAKLKCIHI